MNRLCIVVAMVLERRVGQTYAGRPFGPQRVQRDAQAAIWLNKGSDEDKRVAEAWAAREGYSVHVYQVDEPDPLGRAKADALATVTWEPPTLVDGPAPGEPDDWLGPARSCTQSGPRRKKRLDRAEPNR